MLNDYRALFERSYIFYSISHLRSIDIKSGHWIIDKVFKCFISKGFEYKFPYPIYFNPDISLKNSINIHQLVMIKQQVIILFQMKIDWLNFSIL